MVYTENAKKSIYKWRENNKEKFTEYQSQYINKYRETRREEYNEYMKNFLRKKRELKDFYDDDKWWKILRKITV
jgi:hypothetical protein